MRPARSISALQFGLDRAGDAGRDLVLQIEDIVERAVEAVGPEMTAAARVNQLPGDAYPVAGLPHRAFEDVADAQYRATRRLTTS